MKRDFLSLSGHRREELDEILRLSADLKKQLKAGERHPLLAGQTLAMVFEKPSLRTRVTFEVGMTQLGGYAVYLTPTDIRLGERESVADIARNLDRWVDFIMARTNRHRTLEELAEHASIPVLHALSDHRATYAPDAADGTSVDDPWPRLVGLTARMLADYYERSEERVAPPPLLTGNDLLREFGLEPGPHIRELLEAVREAQVSGEVSSRAEALALVRARL